MYLKTLSNLFIFPIMTQKKNEKSMKNTMLQLTVYHRDKTFLEGFGLGWLLKPFHPIEDDENICPKSYRDILS
jgi:hypothetical protein